MKTEKIDNLNNHWLVQKAILVAKGIVLMHNMETMAQFEDLLNLVGKWNINRLHLEDYSRN